LKEKRGLNLMMTSGLLIIPELVAITQAFKEVFGGYIHKYIMKTENML